MDIHVVTVSIEASVSGKRLDVQGATIVVAVNSIPRIELNCAPAAPKSGKSTPLSPNVIKPTISDFSDLYEYLSGDAEGLGKTGDVKIVARDSQGNSESVQLNGWILSGVGMSSVSATSAPYLTVVLQHPICKTTKAGSIYETPKADNFYALTKAVKTGKTKFTEIMDATYDCAVKTMKFKPAPGKLATEYRQALADKEIRPSTYLDDRTKLFLNPDLNGLESCMALAEAKLVLPADGGSSAWDALSAACGVLLLSVSQDQSNNYTGDKLVLAPKDPWVSPSITLDEERCVSTDLPGMDSFRIIGVMARKLGPIRGGVSQGMYDKSAGSLKKNDTGVGEVMYAPTGVKSSDGRIMKTSAPSVLAMACAFDAAFGSSRLSQGMIEGKVPGENDLDKLLLRYCKAVYQLTARSMCTARAQMVLSFHDSGGSLIVPGATCKFVSKGSTIYYGYINQVTHSMQVNGGCGTIVDMSYVRHTPDYKVLKQVAIPANSKNPAYNK